MRVMNVLIGGLVFLLMSFTIWEPDFEVARKTARDKNQLILLNFSGSDWCGPCIRLRKEIFDSEQFIKMADTTLVMVNADFPRNKKNQPDRQVQQQNEVLAEKYNPTGKFPYTVLLNADGKVIASWDGYPKTDVTHFTEEVKRLCDANTH